MYHTLKTILKSSPFNLSGRNFVAQSLADTGWEREQMVPQTIRTRNRRK